MFALSQLPYPAIDPVLVSIGPVIIRWYALAYLAGILIGHWLIKRIHAQLPRPVLTRRQLDDLMMWAILGIMLGGRLGYVLFYKTDYYLAHPLEILMVWQGGMSFHGGLLGVIGAFYAFARYHHVEYVRLMDMIAAVAPIGLFFGRLANFINGELYGRTSDAPWAMVFPHGGPLPRHPSQLYEALLEGLLLFAVLWVVRTRTPLGVKPGAISGLFLIGYGLSRAFIECFREPDAHLGFVWMQITMGQMLCVPMVMAGLFLLVKSGMQLGKPA